MAFKSLHEECQWELHIGGDDILHAPSKTPTPYSPCVSRTHLNYMTLFKSYKSFFFQPQQHQAHAHSCRVDVPTLLENCHHIAKAMEETSKKYSAKIEGWAILLWYDHHLEAKHFIL